MAVSIRRRRLSILTTLLSGVWSHLSDIQDIITAQLLQHRPLYSGLCVTIYQLAVAGLGLWIMKVSEPKGSPVQHTHREGTPPASRRQASENLPWDWALLGHERVLHPGAVRRPGPYAPQLLPPPPPQVPELTPEAPPECPPPFSQEEEAGLGGSLHRKVLTAG